MSFSFSIFINGANNYGADCVKLILNSLRMIMGKEISSVCRTLWKSFRAVGFD